MASSGGGFRVDPQTLQNLATVLLNIGSDLNMLHDGRDQLQGAVIANCQSVDNFPAQAFQDAGNALCNFAGDWSNGIAQLNKESGSLASALQGAASAYQGTDQQLAQVLLPTGGKPQEQVNVTFGDLTALSSQLAGQMQELAQAIQTVQQQFDVVAGITWESAAEQDFAALYEQWQQSATQIMDSGNGLAQFAGKAGEAYQETEQSLVKGLQS